MLLNICLTLWAALLLLQIINVMTKGLFYRHGLITHLALESILFFGLILFSLAFNLFLSVGLFIGWVWF